MNRSRESDFNPQELLHYSRQISMPQFGPEGQKRLKEAKIAVIGAGGLGSPLLQYLAAAGVGTIGIFDFDVVEKSNLHRQVLYGVDDAGKPKAEVAAERLRNLNPHIQIKAHQTKLTAENAVGLLEPYDIAADGSDNFRTRYIVNDACLLLDIPLVYGSIYRFEGQVTVFNHVDRDGHRGPELHDLFPEMPEEGFIPDCSEAGVLGVLPGVIGSIQAAEVIKIAAGIGRILSGKLLLLDLLQPEIQTIAFSPPDIKRIIDTDAVRKRLQDRTFPGIKHADEISAEELSRLLKNGEEIQLIDVRNREEHQSYNIGGRLMPLDEIEKHTDEISQSSRTIVYCQTGKRSAEAVRILKKHLDGEKLLNLRGGVEAWLELDLK